MKYFSFSVCWLLATSAVLAQPSELLGKSSQTLAELRKITTADAEFDDRFGDSVAISGDILAIGAVRDDEICVDNPTCASGSAYLFGRNEGGANNWGQVRKLTASDAEEEDGFGDAVSLDGDILVVGAGGQNASVGTGKAYAFDISRIFSDGFESGTTDAWASSP